MIENIVILLIGGLSTTAAIIQIYEFVKNKERKRIIWLLVLIGLAGSGTYLSLHKKEQAHESEIVQLKDQLKNENLVKDAEITLNGVNVNNYSEFSQALLDLGKMVDFFTRHKDLYETNYVKFSEMYDSFSILHKKRIQEGADFSIYEENEVVSAVKSGISILESIIKATHNKV